jgi:hypothetical protein
VRLKYVEKVFAFKDAIFGKVSAMNYIFNLVAAEFGSESVRSKMLGNFRVIWSHELSKLSYGVFLSNLKS